MGGEGSISAMRQSLRNNAALLKKSNYYKSKKRYNHIVSNLEVNYKKASPEELQQIRKIYQQKKKKKMWLDVLYILVALGICTLLLVLFV